ncbi:MAG: regulatory iron-sulfur-containing complex subunit RicT [Thermodesulfobacteriota bacterium]|nr:regulatory iron-sulfur-containing complex subunit RicT [Thermodesulfobacteriota bacterium]
MSKAEENKGLVWIKFCNTPTPYIFDGGDLGLKHGDLVIVDTEVGQSSGKVLGDATDVYSKELDDIKPVLRKASQEDIKKLEQIKSNEKKGFNFCLSCINARKLSMKLSKVEQTFDETKTTFYFTAEKRVDFRELLKDLVEKYKTRIELRQIGSRQESAMLGGIGSCGRELCCTKFLRSFQRVSVRMAKDQNLTLNPNKISGICGKLKCCLAYEEEAYSDLINNLPKPGKKVYLDQGVCTVVSINVMNQSFIARTPERRFIKAMPSDVLTDEEYTELHGGEKRERELTNKVASRNTSTEKEGKRSSRRKRRRKRVHE